MAIATDVTVFIVRLSDGKVLFQVRTDDAPRYKSARCAFGEHIEPKDNTSLDAVIRCLDEELALTVIPEECLFLTQYEHDRTVDGKVDIDDVYGVPYPEEQTFELKEGRACEWLGVDEIMHLVKLQEENPEGTKLIGFEQEQIMYLLGPLPGQLAQLINRQRA